MVLESLAPILQNVDVDLGSPISREEDRRNPLHELRIWQTKQWKMGNRRKSLSLSIVQQEVNLLINAHGFQGPGQFGIFQNLV